VAAVLGRQFSGQQLAQVLAAESVDPSAALAELEARGILHRKSLLSSEEYRFGESLTQEVAYESLLLKQRRQLHERIGQLIEALPGDMTAERSALLAHHYTRGESRGKALEALLRAADDADTDGDSVRSGERQREEGPARGRRPCLNPRRERRSTRACSSPT